MAIVGLFGTRAFWQDMRFAVRAAFAAFTVGVTTDDAALIAFCIVHPLNPLCCPTPCPVSDFAKIASFVREADQAWQKVEQCRQIANQYLSLVVAFGSQGILDAELRRVPCAVSDVFKTFVPRNPAALQPGDLGNPRTIAEVLKATMYEPAGLDVVTLTAGIGRVSQRAASISDEALSAIAAGLHGYRRLIDVAGDRGQQTVLASNATTVRSDFAANASARQALVDNLAGLEELVTSWAATEATASSAVHSATIGPLPSSSSSSQTSSLATSLQAEADRLASLRQMRMAVNQLDITTSSLTSLHNERHAAAVMLARYPGLRNTVASDDQAIQFRATDAASIIALLGQVFIDENSVFQSVKTQLSSLDATTWKDSATKTQAANSAAQTVVLSIVANPQSYGGLRTGPITGSGIDDPDGPLAEALANSFAAWLEDDKLERFWAPLRHDAESAITDLDQRLSDINNRLGFDVSGSVALEREQALVTQYNQQVRQIAASGQRGADDERQLILASYIAAFQAAVAAIQSDSTASSFVTVRWPS